METLGVSEYGINTQMWFVCLKNKGKFIIRWHQSLAPINQIEN